MYSQKKETRMVKYSPKQVKKETSIVNKSVKFLSDRGNEVYKPHEEIKIKISPTTCPIMNTSNSYLKYSFKITDNQNYVVPDKKIGCLPFERITIMDGNEQTVLEEIGDIQQLHALFHFYGENKNDKNLRGIFEGRTRHDVWENTMLNNNAPNPIDLSAPVNTNTGGGVTNQYYFLGHQSNPNIVTKEDTNKKVELIYRFKLSGLLNPLRNEILPIIALQGLTIRIKLIDPKKFLKLMTLSAIVGDEDLSYAGMGHVDLTAPLGQQQKLGSIGVAPNPNTFFDDHKVYRAYGYVDFAGAVTTGDLAVGDNWSGIALAKNSDAGNKLKVEWASNFLGCIGGRLRYASKVGADPTDDELYGALTPVIVQIRTIGDRICAMWEQTAVTHEFSQDSAVIPDISNANTCSYEVSDIEMVCDVVLTDPGYLDSLVKNFTSGKTIIQYQTYEDYRINVNTGSNRTELYIPADNTRAWALLHYIENLESASVHNEVGIVPRIDTNTSPSEYQFNINGVQIPQLPISLTRISDQKVSPLQIIELEKALHETNIPVKNIFSPWEFYCIGRSLGRYGNSFNLAENPLRLRVDYTSNTAPILTHNWVYCTKSIEFKGGNRVVVR